ncbi:MAG: spiro-SPASM protein [Spirochaetes bacterium]|nr:spiro-SPASM protein [Spirochaetota bacterium]
MNALLVLFGAQLTEHALLPLTGGKNSLALTLEQSKKFPAIGKTVMLAAADMELPDLPQLQGVEIEKSDAWTKKSLFQAVATAVAADAQGFDAVYFLWADCPFAEPAMAATLAERHRNYGAQYSYADGWPYGICPEILAPGTAGILAAILGDDDGGAVTRDTMFSVIQKDINAFDIEAEIAPVDLRAHRISLCADTKRNRLLLSRFLEENGKIPDSADILRLIQEKPEMLRTLPAFYPVQVSSECPQNCGICPYPKAKGAAAGKQYMEAKQFGALLDKIADFSGDAVIDLSLWGELALHPQKMELIEAVLCRPTLALVIETSGLGWTMQELEKCAQLAAQAAARKNPMPPLSWIVSLDSADSARYKEMRGGGFVEAADCAKKLFALFPKDTYVQAVRTTGAEDDIEKFWRHWKEAAPQGEANIIIQKYDDFCGFLEKKQASDISPVTRAPCWHMMRDMPVLLDGTVPLCRQELGLLSGQSGRALGNAFQDSLEAIWEAGFPHYAQQCGKKYTGLCAGCDEYYTYNF